MTIVKIHKIITKINAKETSNLTNHKFINNKNYIVILLIILSKKDFMNIILLQEQTENI